MGSGQQHDGHKERHLRQSQLSSDKVQHRQRNRSMPRVNSQRTRPKSSWRIVKSGAWENVRNGHCLATVAPNRQLDKALWSNLETRSQRILYIRTLLYIGVSPNTDRESTLRIGGTPKRASRRIENGDTVKKTILAHAPCFPPSSSAFPSVMLLVSLSDFARLISRCYVTWSDISWLSEFAHYSKLRLKKLIKNLYTDCINTV